jgi:hypothetical protein
MANREQRGNREKRKPKAEKPKTPAQAPSFTRLQGADKPKGSVNKKGRT